MDRGWYFRFAVVLTVVVAAVLALWPTLDEWVPAPAWVKETFSGRISPGLDIQGGLRLVYEVDIEEAIKNKRDIIADRFLPELAVVYGIVEEGETATGEQLDALRERVQVRSVGEQAIRVTFNSAADADKVERDWLRTTFPEIAETGRGTEDGKVVMNLAIREESLEALGEDAVDRAVKTIENRVDALGVREMTIMGREQDIIIEIPGGDDLSRLITALLAATLGVERVDNAYRVGLDRDAIARSTGLTLEQVDEALRRLGRETWTDGVGSSAQRRNVIEVDGDHVRITNLDELKAHSTFEQIRTIVSRTARLDFKVVDESATYLNAIEVPAGSRIEKRSEASEDGPGRQVSSTYFYLSGADSRRQMQDFVNDLMSRTNEAGERIIPEGREIVISTAEPPQGVSGDEAQAWRTYSLVAITDVSGGDVKDAFVGQDEQQRPVVILQFNSEGADKWARMTGDNVRRRVAIVLDDVVESAPSIRERIGGGNTQISLGGYRGFEQLNREAAELVVVLKAGALPAPIRPINEQLIGPTLGRDSVRRGAEGAIVGIGLVLLFMLIYYQVAGIVADAMVLMNLLFLMATLAFFEATLTLPGVAGIALTVGMAVDANVLITERIREELRLGKSPRAAVDQGFRRAFWSIFDAQITTFIAGVVLFQYGTGPIKGFAVTLMIGIGTSLFTGVFCSKVGLDWIVRGLRVQRLRVG